MLLFFYFNNTEKLASLIGNAAIFVSLVNTYVEKYVSI